MPIPAQPVQKGSGSVSVAPFQALPHGSLMATGMQQAHGTLPTGQCPTNKLCVATDTHCDISHTDMHAGQDLTKEESGSNQQSQHFDFTQHS